MTFFFLNMIWEKYKFYFLILHVRVYGLLSCSSHYGEKSVTKGYFTPVFFVL